MAGFIKVIHTQPRPIEVGFQLRQRYGVDHFVYLNGAQNPALCERVEQKTHDLDDRWVGLPQIQTRGLIQRFAPGGRDERDHELTGGRRNVNHGGPIIGVQYVDGQRERREISTSEPKHPGVQFKPYTARTWQVTQQPI